MEPHADRTRTSSLTPTSTPRRRCRSACVEADRVNLATAVAESARDAGVKVREIEASAGASLVRLASLMSLGDYAVTYAALGLGVDPTDSPHVADLRRRTDH